MLVTLFLAVCATVIKTQFVDHHNALIDGHWYITRLLQSCD